MTYPTFKSSILAERNFWAMVHIQYSTVVLDYFGFKILRHWLWNEIVANFNIATYFQALIKGFIVPNYNNCIFFYMYLCFMSMLGLEAIYVKYIWVEYKWNGSNNVMTITWSCGVFFDYNIKWMNETGNVMTNYTNEGKQ